MAELENVITPNDHIQGCPDHAVTVLEYGDYECPYCLNAYQVVKKLQRYFGADLCFVYRHFPVEKIHPHAMSAAQTAEFAAAHGKFWPVHDALFEHQAKLGMPLYEKIIADVNLSVTGLMQALKKRAYGPVIVADFNSGVALGVNGTPCFFIDGNRYNGPTDFESIGEAIQEKLVSHAHA